MSRIRTLLTALVLVSSVSCGPAEPSLQGVKKALPDAEVVLVLGDSTGNDIGEWVELWAQDVSQVRSVTYHYWNPDLERFPPEVDMGGDGPGLDLWNLSQPGETAAYPRPFLPLVEQEPDVVLYSFGHNHTADNIGPALLETMDRVEDRWGDVPAAWVLQNPSTTFRREQQADTIERLRQLSRDEGVPIIDVYDAFPKDSGELDGLLRDGTHPNEEASRLWADVVEAALGYPLRDSAREP